MMLLLAKRASAHTRDIQVILLLHAHTPQASVVTDTVTGDAGEKEGSCRILNLLLQDRERENVRKRCVCVGDSCPCAKAGLMLHTIARVWVRGSWRLNVLYSRGRRGAVRGES